MVGKYLVICGSSWPQLGSTIITGLQFGSNACYDSLYKQSSGSSACIYKARQWAVQICKPFLTAPLCSVSKITLWILLFQYNWWELAPSKNNTHASLLQKGMGTMSEQFCLVFPRRLHCRLWKNMRGLQNTIMNGFHKNAVHRNDCIQCNKV